MSKIRRTVSYLKRNGIANTITAVLERIDKKGLERLSMQLLGEENVREACLFPRDMTRLEP